MDYEQGAQYFSALSAFVAAVFWFVSASVKIPNFLDTPMTELTAPFLKAAKLNSYAAISAGISAATQGLIMAFFQLSNDIFMNGAN